MTLEACMEIGKSCGFYTIEECYDCIYHHAMNIFKYDEINKELLELQKDIFFNDADLFCKIFYSTKDDLTSKGWKTKTGECKNE